MNNTISADFPFRSHYLAIDGSNMHFIDEGEGDPILFLHGNPTSIYLWRNVIPYLTKPARCIALDLIGMGKSDKPNIPYRFFDHYHYVEGFIQALNLKNVTLVLHDWGAALGFHYAMLHPENVKGIAFMEALMEPIPSIDALRPQLKELFTALRHPDIGEELLYNQNMFVEQMLPRAVLRTLTAAEMDTYRAPFQEVEHRKPIYQWTQEVSIGGKPDDVTQALKQDNQQLQESDLPKLLLYGEPGFLITAPVVEWAQTHLKHLSVVNIGAGLHYLQEDQPDAIGAALAAWYATL